MSYEPTNWKAGDVVTSAKLNKMEQGIAASGGIRIVHLTEEDASSGDDPKLLRAASVPATPVPIMKLDITPNELMDAFDNEKIVVIITYEESHGGLRVTQCLIHEFVYDGITYTVATDDFPELTSSDPDEYFTYNPNSSDDSGGSYVE